MMSPEDHERAVWLLGPWVCPPINCWQNDLIMYLVQLLGGALGIFLQGILYCQVASFGWASINIWPRLPVYALCYPFQKWRDGDQSWCFHFVHPEHLKNDTFIVSLLLKYHQGKLKIMQYSCLAYIHRLLHRPRGCYRPQLHFLVGVRQLAHRALFRICLYWPICSDLFFLWKNATIDLYVQVFFIRRLHLISNRNWWVTAPVTFVLAFAYAAMCVAVGGFKYLWIQHSYKAQDILHQYWSNSS